MCLRHLYELRLDQVWVVFDLQRGDGVLRVGLDIVERLGLKVGDANRFGDALVDKGFHLLPCFADGDLGGLDGFAVLHPPALHSASVPDPRAEENDGGQTYWVSLLFRVDVLESTREVDEEEVNVF